MTNEPLTLDDIFDDTKFDRPGAWDISWVEKIKMPVNLGSNMSVATKFMTETSRAVEFLGDKIAVLVFLTDKAKLDYETEWSMAFKLRAQDKTAAGKKIEAESDPVYLEKKTKHIRFKGYLEYFRQKQSAMIGHHNAAKEILRTHRNELPMSGWDTTDNAYKEANAPEARSEDPNHEEEDNFDLD